MASDSTPPADGEPTAAPIAAALGLDDDPTDFEPTGRALVVSDPFDSLERLVVMDRHDEQLMMQELQGRVLDVMLYSFEQAGETLTDLSVQGVYECVRVMNATGKVRIHIAEESLRIETSTEDVGSGPEDCWIATVYATDPRTGFGQFGTFVQSKRTALTASKAAYRKQKRTRDGKAHGVADDNTVANPFARQIALNKAQRNALRAMIPERIRQALIAQYLGDTDRVRVIEVGAGARNIADLPPKLTDDRAQALHDEIKRVYDLLHAAAPIALLPAQLYAYTIRAQHSHTELEALLEYVRDKARAAGVEVPDADA